MLLHRAVCNRNKQGGSTWAAHAAMPRQPPARLHLQHNLNLHSNNEA